MYGLRNSRHNQMNVILHIHNTDIDADVYIPSLPKADKEIPPLGFHAAYVSWWSLDTAQS